MIKRILLSEKPSILIKKNKDDIFKIIPELKRCEGFNQHNDYHQYDVLEHILNVVDKVENDYVLRLAALFHDIGKPDCFTIDDNSIGHFYGHWEASNKIFNKYLDKLELNENEIKLINNLIYYHDLEFNSDTLEKLKRIFKEDFKLLISLKRADVLSQNHKYLDRLDILNKIESEL